MKTFLLLIRVQLLALVRSFAPRARKAHRRIGATLFALCYALLALIAAAYMVMLGIVLATIGLADAIPAFAVLMSSIAGVAFTFLKANGTLFGLADFDLVMALPIPRRTVVASRVAALYISATLLGAVFSLPLWGVYLVQVNASVWTVLCCAVSLVLAPAVPTTIATFLAFGVTAASARFRHANIAYIVIALVAFTALIMGMYSLSFSAGVNGDEVAAQQMAGGLTAVSDAIGIGWPPARWIADACSSGAALPLVLFLLVSLGVPAVALEIMQRFYLAINAALACGKRGRVLSTSELKSRASTASGPFRALVIKEYRTILGVPTYAFNCLFGYLFMIVIAVALGVVGLDSLLASGAIDGVEVDAASYGAVAHVVANALPWAFVCCSIMSPSAACSISMEGRSAWICATAPLPARTILGAKLAANALPVAGSLAASALILLATGQTNALGALQVLLAGFGASYLMVNIGMSIDARQPNLSWSSPNEVIKRGTSITVTIIGGMVLTFAGGAVAIALSLSAGAVAGAAWNVLVGVAGTAAGQFIFQRTCRATHLYLA